MVRSVHDIDSAKWNQVTRGPFFSHEWFQFVEQTERKQYQFYYLVAYESDKLIGALPVLIPMSSGNIYQNYLYGKLRPMIDKTPVKTRKLLLCYSPASSGSNFWSDQPFLSNGMSAYIDSLDELAQQEGVSEIVFMFLRGHEIDILERLTARGYNKIFLSAAAVLENRFNSFDGYLHSLTRNGSNGVKGDLRRFKKAGCVLEVCRHPIYKIKIIDRLMKNVQKKYPRTLTRLEPDSLKVCFEKMRPYATTYLVRRNRTDIGTVTLFNKDALLSTYASGLDYDHAKETGVYFYLFYYLPIQEMIRKNIAYLNFNHMAYRTKETRGATLISQYMLVKNVERNPAKQFWFGIVDRRYRVKFRKEYAQEQKRRTQQKATAE